MIRQRHLQQLEELPVLFNHPDMLLNLIAHLDIFNTDVLLGRMMMSPM